MNVVTQSAVADRVSTRTTPTKRRRTGPSETCVALGVQANKAKSVGRLRDIRPRVMEMAERGMGPTAIADALNEANIRTTRGGSHTKSTVWYIMQRDDV